MSLHETYNLDRPVFPKPTLFSRMKAAIEFLFPKRTSVKQPDESAIMKEVDIEVGIIRTKTQLCECLENCYSVRRNIICLPSWFENTPIIQAYITSHVKTLNAELVKRENEIIKKL